jgi:hypothetical protein
MMPTTRLMIGMSIIPARMTVAMSRAVDQSSDAQQNEMIDWGGSWDRLGVAWCLLTY